MITKDEALSFSTSYFEEDKLAAKTFVDKYSMENNGSYEMTPTEMHRRMAKEFARIENKFGGKNKLNENQIFDLFAHFKYIVPGGSVMSGLGNPSYVGSLSNCFVVGQPEDSYSSIMKYRNKQVQLMKRRGGVGIDLSKLRPEGTTVNNAAKTSTGPVSFMNVFSEITKEVALNGRRGALMISISGDHPDVEKFIECKKDLSKITGANISIKFSDKFMKAVENNEDYYLHWPVDKYPDFPAPFEYNVKYWSHDSTQCAMKVHAKEIWDKFVHYAWANGEPGIMYEDKHYDLSPDSVYEQYKGVTTNPCVTGDTIVKTNFGNITIKDVIDKFNNGEEIKVLSYNTNESKEEYKKITNGLKTRENANIIEIETEDGKKIKLTPDHKVFTENRGYVCASQLTEKDILLEI